jgi:hypothetical protein
MVEIEVLGAYVVPGHPDVCLIEIRADVAPSELDVGAITQEDPNLPEDSWQATWHEHYLSPEGDEVIGEWLSEPIDDPGPTRLAFFLHRVDFERPLLTQFGPVPLPPPTAMPKRLRRIVDYEQVE